MDSRIPGFEKLSINKTEPSEPSEPPEPPVPPEPARTSLQDLPLDLVQRIFEINTQGSETPCDDVAAYCQASKASEELCSNAEFWKVLCELIPSYQEKAKAKPKDYEGEEKLKYWKRRFDAWCRGRALVNDRVEEIHIPIFLPLQDGGMELHPQSNPRDIHTAVAIWGLLPNEKLEKHSVGPIEEWYVEDVTNMDDLFDATSDIANTQRLENFNVCLNKWDFSNVTTAKTMFFGRKNFNNGDKPIKFNTNSAQDFEGMFESCIKLNVPVELDTSSATNMKKMFCGCSDFNNEGKPIKLNTPSVKEFQGMFRRCPKLNVPVELDTSSAKNMKHMFLECSDFNNGGKPIKFNTTSVEEFQGMFEDCPEFNVPVKLDTSSAINMRKLFEGCRKFNNGGEPIQFKSAIVENVDLMFRFCNNLDVPVSLDTNKATSLFSMFAHCTAFNNGNTALKFNTENVETFEAMFYECPNFNVPVLFKTSKGVSFKDMFYECKTFNQNIKFETDRAETMTGMFEGCKAYNNGGEPLEFNTGNVTFFTDMFKGCGVFNQEIRFDFSKAIDLHSMFYGCGQFNNGTQSVSPLHINSQSEEPIDMSQMFQDCKKFNQTCNFDTTYVGDMNGMFQDCEIFNNGGKPLKFNTKSVNVFRRMFKNCLVFKQPCYASAGLRVDNGDDDEPFTYIPGENMGWDFSMLMIYPDPWNGITCMFENCPNIAAISRDVWKLPKNIDPENLFRVIEDKQNVLQRRLGRPLTLAEVDILRDKGLLGV